MDIITPSLPEPKIDVLKIVKLRENRKKIKKEKPCKYLDQLFKTDAFLKEYFEEK
jgi:hypothetical protein